VAVDVDPGLNRSQLKTTVESRDRFPDLKNKRVWQDQIEVIPEPDVYVRRDDGGLELVAMGESPWLSDVRGADVSVVENGDATRRKPKRLPRFARYGLRKIRENPVYSSPDQKIEVVCPDGKTDPVFSLPIVANDDLERVGHSRFVNRDGRTRQRRGCYAVVSSRESRSQYTQYILMLEGRSWSSPISIVLVDDVLLLKTVEISEMDYEYSNSEKNFGRGAIWILNSNPEVAPRNWSAS
jgi:hypothetical protein